MTQGLFGNLPGAPDNSVVSGRLIRITVFKTSAYFTKHPATKTVLVEVRGGAGGGGGQDDFGGGGGTCFPAGTLVTLADGRKVPIEFIKIGDRVLTRYGRADTVIALDRPLLGPRRMWLVNGELHTTAEHRFWHDRLGCFTCIDPGAQMAEWNRAHTLITEEGLRDVVKPPLSHTTLAPLLVGDVVLGEAGLSREITSLVELPKADWPDTTQLYNLVVDGAHMFFANGYLVSGFARDDDFDYTTWTARDASAPAQPKSKRRGP